MTKLIVILEALHGWGIAHNDVKLENILLNDSGEVHLVDFGSSIVCHCDHHEGIRRRVLEGDDGSCYSDNCTDDSFMRYCDSDYQKCSIVMYQLFTGLPIPSEEARGNRVPEKKAALRRVSKGEILTADEVRGLFE
mmetsp:Transcript_17048/g.14216  ORF Transcript_17048/g.14216 Transcript_17048/m.14216 type:complete len:136 (+) Transcript_17048:261-668(+)